MTEFTMIGGYNDSFGEPEEFTSTREACEAWADRYHSNGVRKVGGFFFPGWGEMGGDDTAIATEYEGLSKRVVLAIADGADIPSGWWGL